MRTVFSSRGWWSSSGWRRKAKIFIHERDVKYKEHRFVRDIHYSAPIHPQLVSSTFPNHLQPLTFITMFNYILPVLFLVTTAIAGCESAPKGQCILLFYGAEAVLSNIEYDCQLLDKDCNPMTDQVTCDPGTDLTSSLSMPVHIDSRGGAPNDGDLYIDFTYNDQHFSRDNYETTEDCSDDLSPCYATWIHFYCAS